jgi:hypothetical protein
MRRATELEFLRFYQKKAAEWYADGGTDEDYWIKEEFVEQTGKRLPKEYDDPEEDE